MINKDGTIERLQESLKIVNRWCRTDSLDDPIARIELAMTDALELLKEQEPQVMTLEEVIAHYSLPPVFADDLSAQADYLEDIKPLYFDFHVDNPWAVHWRSYHSGKDLINHLKVRYGVTWRCWTAKPTDEQRKAVKCDAM